MTARPAALHTINRNGLWCRVIADALIDSGVQQVVLCPGGRNSMMALTLHHSEQLTCLPHIDERSGAFIALGLAAATARPAAICTTSGSAVANLLPALCEAAPRRVPLILLTCDRPLRGRRSREPQCTEQTAICKPLLRAQLTLDDPSDNPAALRELRAAVLELLSQQDGPVQINIPQHGARCAAEQELGWRTELTAESIRSSTVFPCGRASSQNATLAEVEAAANAVRARPGMKGLIVAGPETPFPPAALADFVQETRFPLLADVASGLRCTALPALSTAEGLVRSTALGFAQTEILIRLGAAPVSIVLQRAVTALSCPVLAIAGHDPGSDFLNGSAQGLLPPSMDGLAALARRFAPGDATWADCWRAAEEAASTRRAASIDRLPWGEVQAASMICNAPGFDLLHLGNSLAVRHASLVTRSDGLPRAVYTARGVNGIDGNLSLFLGEMLATGSPGLALVGDQTATHDLPALANVALTRLRGAICIMNNGGGAIFEFVACGRLPGFEQVMRNAPRVDFSGIATAFGIPHFRCADALALATALTIAAEGDELVMIEVTVPPHSARREIPVLLRQMTG